MIRLTAQNTFVLAEEGESPRSISGVAVPWDTEAIVSDGTRVRFERGSLPITGKKPKLLKYHDSEQPVGVVTGRLDSDEGMLFTARISATSEGNDMLELIKDEAVDSVSVGVDVVDASYDDNGTMIIKKANWVELSLVTAPAFKGAMITEVAATEPQEETTTMSEVKVEASAEAPAPAPQLLWAEAKPAFKLPTPSEYMAKFARGGSEFAELNARIKAAAPDITTTDTPGILPTPIVSPVYDSLNPIRPFVTAIGARAMPAGGATFRRPVITVRPTVTQQPTGQLNTLDPSTVTVANNNVSKLTFGTYVTLSEQDIDWTDPDSLAIVLNQLAIAYGQATDNYAVDTMVSGVTQTETITDLSDSADWIAAIYGAAYQISNASNYLPTHFFAAPVTWAKLGMIVDDANRPLFPSVAPYNAFGVQTANSWNGNPLGLSLVVDKNMAGSTGAGGLNGVVGHAAGPAAGFEFYEQQKGAISVDVPATLGRTIAFRGYAAAFMADATKFVKLLKS
jgi:HK97 family phage prohead protease